MLGKHHLEKQVLSSVMARQGSGTGSDVIGVFLVDDNLHATFKFLEKEFEKDVLYSVSLLFMNSLMVSFQGSIVLIKLYFY